MEDKTKMTAIPMRKCIYPRCLECPSYVVHEGERFCTVPMVISKQIYFDLRMEINRINNILKDLENSLYDEILGLNEADKVKDAVEGRR